MKSIAGRVGQGGYFLQKLLSQSEEDKSSSAEVKTSSSPGRYTL